VVVSNHGGNDLDTVVPSLVALPAVAEAVGGRAHVLFDGGIRRGADVVKALALGADGVLIGRAAAWATAARGQRGVAEILDVFGRDIRQTLRALGVQAVADVGPEHVVQGPEFAALRAAFARQEAVAPIG
jgi:isopentenyl diphosphate isomerase/L-lactate dehydrogenase-like FMN-dependent dehydrogenase